MSRINCQLVKLFSRNKVSQSSFHSSYFSKPLDKKKLTLLKEKLDKATFRYNKDLKTFETWRASYKKAVNYDDLTEQELITTGIREEYNSQNEKGMKQLTGYG